MILRNDLLPITILPKSRHIVHLLYKAVRLGGTDIPLEEGADPMLFFTGRPMSRGEEGIWELTLGPLEGRVLRHREGKSDDR